MMPGWLLSPSSYLRVVWPSALLARPLLLALIPLAVVLASHVQLLHASRLSDLSALQRHLQGVTQEPGLSREALRLERSLLGLLGRIRELGRWKALGWGEILAREVAFVDDQNQAVFCQHPVLCHDQATY